MATHAPRLALAIVATGAALFTAQSLFVSRQTAHAQPNNTTPGSVIMVEGRIASVGTGTFTLVTLPGPICYPTPGHFCPMVQSQTRGTTPHSMPRIGRPAIILAPRTWRVDDSAAAFFMAEGRVSPSSLRPGELAVVYGTEPAEPASGAAASATSTNTTTTPRVLPFLPAGTIDASGVYILTPRFGIVPMPQR